MTTQTIIEGAISGPVEEAVGYATTRPLSELNEALSRGSESWQRLASCPACESRRLGRFATIRSFAHNRCRDCGFTFVNPIPPDSVLYSFYNSPFYANYRRRESKQIAVDRYFSASMYTEMSRLAEWLGTDRSISVLDFGCGTGAFLAYLREKAGIQNVEGLEISRRGIEIGTRVYGLSIVPTSDQLHSSSFDVVTLIEVIEHVPEPDVFLKLVAPLVKPGGRLLITTPSVDNLSGRLAPRHCRHFTAPSHVSLFTPAAMKRLLERAGFAIERIEVDDFDVRFEEWLRDRAFNLDFLGPQHDQDGSDLLFRPNWLGRSLGFSASRNAAVRAGRFSRFVNRVAAGVLRRTKYSHTSDHLYVLARRDLASAQSSVAANDQ